MDKWMDRQRDKMTNECPPVFYRTSSPSGPLPKKELLKKDSKKKRKKKNNQKDEQTVAERVNER